MTSGGVVKHGIVHKIADEDDDEALRALLRETPVAGWITLSYERIGSYFRTPLAETTHQAVIGLEVGSGTAAAMFARTLLPAHVNGEISQLAYLGDLRIRPAFRNRIRLIRDGFQTLRNLSARPGNPGFHLTSIVTENRAARRLLEAGLEGLPVYEPLGAFHTLAIKPRRNWRTTAVRPARAADADQVVAFANRVFQRRQFAPVIRSAHELTSDGWRNLAIGDFLLYEDRCGVRGLIAVWDQSQFRRTVVRGYRVGIAAIRPLLNVVSPITGFPTLPAIGQDLRQVYLSLLCTEDDEPSVAIDLVGAALTLAAHKRADLALLGAPANWLPGRALHNRFRSWKYESIFYLVYWPDEAAALEGVHRLTPFVEIALL